MIEQYMTITITQKMYGWSKYGGARQGYVKEELDTWYCQACGSLQIQLLPSYMIPMNDMDREYGRVCTTCKARSNLKRLKYLGQLLNLMR